MILEVTPHYRLKPFGRFHQRVMHSLFQLGVELLQLRCHAFADRLTDYGEIACLPMCPTDVSETQKTEGLRSSFATLFPSFDGVAPEFDQARFLRM